MLKIKDISNKIGEDLSNTILSFSSKLIGMVIFLCTDIVIARLLSKDNYGEWSFYYSVVSMCFWLVWFGINEAAKVFVAKTSEDTISQNNTIIAALKLRCIVSFIWIIILLLVWWLGNGYISNYFVKYPNLTSLLLSGVFLSFFNSISEFFKAVYIGLIRFRYIFVITIVEFCGNFLFGIGLLYITGAVVGLGWGYVIAAFCTNIWGSYLLKKYLKKNSYEALGKTYTNKKMKAIFHYAMPLFVVSIGALLLTEVDVFMLGVMREGAETGIYSIAKNLMGKVTHINLAICTSTMTAFAVINESNILNKKFHFIKIMKINMVLSLVISLGIYIFAPLIVTILYGAQYEMVGAVIRYLIPYYIFFSVTIFMAALVDYQGMANKRIFSYFLMIFLNVLLNYLLIPKYGAVGAAIATDISMIPYVVGLVYLSIKVFLQKNIGDI